MTATYYDILEVSVRATPETIRAAFRSLMQRHHPDKRGACSVAAQRARELLQAYEALSHAGRRAGYDARLARAQHGAAVRASREHAQAARKEAYLRMDARHAQATTLRMLAPVLLMAGLIGLGAIAKSRFDLPLTALGDLWRAALVQAGDRQWLMSTGRLAVLLLLLTPTVSLLFMKRQLLLVLMLVLPLPLALGCAGSPQQVAGCYNGSLEACFDVLTLHH